MVLWRWSKRWRGHEWKKLWDVRAWNVTERGVRMEQKLMGISKCGNEMNEQKAWRLWKEKPTAHAVDTRTWNPPPPLDLEQFTLETKSSINFTPGHNKILTTKTLRCYNVGKNRSKWIGFWSKTVRVKKIMKQSYPIQISINWTLNSLLELIRCKIWGSTVVT